MSEQKHAHKKTSSTSKTAFTSRSALIQRNLAPQAEANVLSQQPIPKGLGKYSRPGEKVGNE